MLINVKIQVADNTDTNLPMEDGCWRHRHKFSFNVFVSLNVVLKEFLHRHFPGFKTRDFWGKTSLWIHLLVPPQSVSCLGRRAFKPRLPKITEAELLRIFKRTPRQSEFAVRFNREPFVGLEVLIDFRFVQCPLIDAEFVNDAFKHAELAIGPAI